MFEKVLDLNDLIVRIGLQQLIRRQISFARYYQLERDLFLEFRFI